MLEEIKDKNFIAIIEEDTTPYVCGFKKGVDIYFSISVKVYKNNRGNRGTFLAKYTNQWAERVELEVILSFVTDILNNPFNRDKYNMSSNSWDGILESDVSKLERSLNIVLEKQKNLKESIPNVDKVENVQKSLLHIPKGTILKDVNMSLKLDALSLLISDEDIEILKSKLIHRPAILYGIRLLMEGLDIELAINTAKGIMK